VHFDGSRDLTVPVPLLFFVVLFRVVLFRVVMLLAGSMSFSWGRVGHLCSGIWNSCEHLLQSLELVLR
jgi:hypothetical protein